MSLWAFRFLLWYICILFIQPQNRFTFLWPFHIADIAVVSSLGLHFMACMQEKRPLIRFGPATIAALLLLVAGMLSLHFGVFQTNTAWNAHIDLLAKSVLLLVMVEAMTTTPERVWAVLTTMMLATLWWIKGGLRLSLSGATYSGDRIMGPAVSMIENPNGFAYMMCVMIPLYLYFYQQAEEKWLKYTFIGIALSAVFIVFETGSRTGMLILIALGIFLLPKYGRHHKKALVIGGVAIFVLFSAVSPGNIERIKSIPRSIAAALSGEVRERGQMDQNEQSAQERRLKNEQTWGLIKDYPIFGVGITPNEEFYAQEYPYAMGQVHCEILMAGKQMGLIGMALYAAFVGGIFVHGRKVQSAISTQWSGIADLGWTLKLQAVTIAVGGAFSPLPWNVVTLILAGTASSLWANIRSRQESIEGVAVPAVQGAPI